MSSKQTVFETLSKINVSDKTEKKGQFTYLSWAFAWEQLKKVAPEAKVTVYENAEGLPYFASSAGVIVKVGLTIEGTEHISYLPCMNFSNKAIKQDAVTMMDVNKAIQRATVKAIALHGLGLYIYAGEDLPIDDSKPKAKTPPKPTTSKQSAAPKAPTPPESKTSSPSAWS